MRVMVGRFCLPLYAVPMALTKTYLGLNDDGTPHFHYKSDKVLVFTGKVYGPVTTSDGKVYDVSDDVIEVEHEAHAGEVSHLIGMKHEENGHPDDGPDEAFKHACSDHCGVLKRS